MNNKKKSEYNDNYRKNTKNPYIELIKKDIFSFVGVLKQ